MRKMFKKCISLVIVLVLLTCSFALNTHAAPEHEYWKVIGWDWDSNTGNFTFPTHAVLQKQDGFVTKPGYGWTATSHPYYTEKTIHLMINKNDLQVKQQKNGEVLKCIGNTAHGVPVILYTVEPNSFSRITLDSYPPCFVTTPSAYLLNGSSNANVKVDVTKPIMLDASKTTTSNGYYLSVQLSDQNGNGQGTPVTEMLQENRAPYYFSKYGFNITQFCSSKNYTLQAGKYYLVKLAVSPWHETTKLMYTDNLAPTTPGTPGIYMGGVKTTTASLYWGVSSDNVGVQAYNVYVDGVLKDISGDNYSVISGLAPNTEYYITVTAKDAGGNESAPSNTLAIKTPPDTTAPLAPTTLCLYKGGVKNTTVSLYWRNSSDDVGVVKNKFYFNGILKATINRDYSTTISGLTPNTKYDITVTAIDAAGNESAPSNTLTVTTTP